jgi:hypothetical protein
MLRGIVPVAFVAALVLGGPSANAVPQAIGLAVLARPASISDPMAGVAGRTIEAMSERRPLL